MKKLLVLVFLVSMSLAACGGSKKGDTTPAATETPATETTPGATGGATYGAPAGVDAADPCAAGSTDPCAGQ